MDRPGGHAEPSHAMEVAGAETLTEVTWQQVRQELFSCIQREVRDELNIPLDFQQPPELLGTVINHQAAGRLCNVCNNSGCRWDSSHRAHLLIHSYPTLCLIELHVKLELSRKFYKPFSVPSTDLWVLFCVDRN